MTKMKSKKMTKSTFAIIIMAIAMVAMLAFGGTYAYFTATATAFTSREIQTATVKLTNQTTTDTEMTVKSNVLPGEYVYENASITLKNDSTVAIYVFATFSANIYAEGDTDKTEITLTEGGKIITETVTYKDDTNNTTSKWNKIEVDGETVYYQVVAATEGVGATPEAFAFSLQFSEEVQANFDQESGEEENNTTAESIMGVNIEVSVNFRAIQQLNYEVGETYTTEAAAAEAAYEASLVEVGTGARA